MIEIIEEEVLQDLDVSKGFRDVSSNAYELTGDYLRFANEQLYAQMMGWA